MPRSQNWNPIPKRCKTKSGPAVLTNLQLTPPGVLTQVWWQPPFSTAHSSMSSHSNVSPFNLGRASFFSLDLRLIFSNLHPCSQEHSNVPARFVQEPEKILLVHSSQKTYENGNEPPRHGDEEHSSMSSHSPDSFEILVFNAVNNMSIEHCRKCLTILLNPGWQLHWWLPGRLTQSPCMPQGLRWW